jgi:hypothetical protein
VFLQYGVTDYVAYSEKAAKELKAAAWKQWQEDGYLELGRDYRIIEDIGIEPDPGEMIQLKAVNAELLAALKGLSESMCMAEEGEHTLDCDDAATCTLCTARRAIATAEGLASPLLE